MATKTLSMLVDDLEGTPIEEGSGETVLFGLDGATYEIDLTLANAEKLRTAVSPFVGHARRIAGRRKPGSTARTARPKPRVEHSPREVRDWGRTNGFDVPSRGRIPEEVQTAFNAAR